MADRDYSRTIGRVILECHHALDFPKPWPKEGEELYCRKCQTVRVVKLTPKRVARKVPGLPV